MSGGFGAFGKMPSVGDFFRMNAPSGFVSAWDTWIQTGMLAGQQRLGDAWDTHYMSAPIWRFCLAPGLAGQRKVLGVMMPSVDRVGRRFPLTLMATSDHGTSPLLDHFGSDDLFATLENLALDALEDGMTRDGLETRLSEMPAVPDANGTAVRVHNGSLVVNGSSESATPLPGLSAALIGNRYANPSVWSCLIEQGPRMLICNGLPQGGDMQGLFDLNAPVWSEAPMS